MKIKWVLFLLLAVLLGGCAKPQPMQPTSYEFVIGVSQSNLIEPLQVALYEQMHQRIKQYPNARLVFCDAAGDSVRQISDIEKLLQLEVDLLIVSPVNARDISETIEAAHKKLPMIVLGTAIDTDAYDMFIGANNYRTGYLAGAYTAQLMGADGGTVVEITGAEDSPPTQQLSEGFADALQEHPEISVLATLNGDWLRDTAERRMKDFLIQQQKVDVVFAHSDAMAYGAHIAVEDFRVKDIQLIGVDGLEAEGKRMVDTGILAGTFYRNTGGSEAIDWAMKILQGATQVPRELVFEPTQYPLRADTE